MAHEKIVKLERVAKKGGGDRYLANDGFQIYIPQEISRDDEEKVVKTFKIIFEEVKNG